MYTNTDSTNYATVSNTRSGTTSYYLYIRGFNFDAIPSSATITDWTVKLKASESGGSTNSSYAPKLCHGTSQITSTMSAITTSVTTREFTGVSADWEDIVNYGDDFGIRINCRRNSRNTTANFYIYGAEIEVTYTVPNPRSIAVTLSGEGTVSPSGTTTSYDGENFTLTITPDNKADTVTVTHDGTDVTDQLEAHYNSGSSISKTAESYTTDLSTSNADFYTGSGSTGDYFDYAVGHTAESPASTSSSYNTYVKDNGSNTATGWATYSFDFSAIPSNAVIESVEVKCYGASESSTHDSTHKAEVTLYSGSTQKSTTQNFSSTSNSIMTISDAGEWTRAELQDAKLRFTVAYYGGHLFGITWKVTYSVAEDPDYYTYEFTVSGDANIAVDIGGGESALYVKYDSGEVGEESFAGSVYINDADIPYSSADGMNHFTQSMDLSSFSMGDTCRIEGSLYLMNGGTTVNQQDISQSFTWTGNNSYTVGIYTITMNATTFDVKIERSYATSGLYASYNSALGGRYIYIYRITGGSVWLEVLKAYKKVNGAWVAQSDLKKIFSQSVRIIKGN